MRFNVHVVGSKNAKITGSKIIKLTQTPKLRVTKIKGFTVILKCNKQLAGICELRWGMAEMYGEFVWAEVSTLMSGANCPVGKCFGEIYPRRECLGEVSGRKWLEGMSGGTSRKNAQIPMQDYKSTCSGYGS